MKRIAKLVVVLALGLPVLANASEDKNQNGKDLCLLSGVGCSSHTDSVAEMIVKLDREVEKGTSVYSAEEIATLERKSLEYCEMNNMLSTM